MYISYKQQTQIYDFYIVRVKSREIISKLSIHNKNKIYEWINKIL